MSIKVQNIHKFGRNEDVGTGFEPVSQGGIYRTPQASGATALRVKAGNANDTSDGSGARKVKVFGLDENFNYAEEVLTTNGTSAGPNSTTTFTRVYRAFITESGTYATQTAGSHSADITIENAAGTEDWITIDAADFPKGQSEVGCISIAKGYYAYIHKIDIGVDSNKTADIILFSRGNIDQTAAPYDAMRARYTIPGVSGVVELNFSPESGGDVDMLGPFEGPCDVGFMAKASTSSIVAVNFEIDIFKSEF